MDLRWRQVKGGWWQGEAVMSVCGVVEKETDNRWRWKARVMLNCRDEFMGPAISGKALSFDGAKRIVQVLCEETGTIPKGE